MDGGKVSRGVSDGFSELFKKKNCVSHIYPHFPSPHLPGSWTLVVKVWDHVQISFFTKHIFRKLTNN